MSCLSGRDFRGHCSPPSLPHRLAAVALLVLDEEESAFWCLVAIVEAIMPVDYYSKTLTASQVSGAWRDLVAAQASPKLSRSRRVSGKSGLPQNGPRLSLGRPGGSRVLAAFRIWGAPPTQ